MRDTLNSIILEQKISLYELEVSPKTFAWYRGSSRKFLGRGGRGTSYVLKNLTKISKFWKPTEQVNYLLVASSAYA